MEFKRVELQIAWEDKIEQAEIIPELLGGETIWRIKVSDILGKVNNFIKTHGIKKFVDIKIKNKKDWVNIADVFSCSDVKEFETEIRTQKYLIELMLVDSEKISSDETIIEEWKKEVASYNESFEKVSKTIKEVANNLEDHYKLDLAFFFSEPIVNSSNEKTSKKVSFYDEVFRIISRIGERAIRSMMIEIEVAYERKIINALKNGVKILHFSCHGEENHLEIEDDRRENVGVSFHMNHKRLKELLTEHIKILPKIIVLNACHSDKLAESLHEFQIENEKRFEYITTIGYRGKVQNEICEEISEIFYSQIFKGHSINEFVKKYSGYKDMVIFHKNSENNTFKCCEFHEVSKKVEVRNKLEDNIDFDYQSGEWLKFMTRCIQEDDAINKNILHLAGKRKTGKSRLMKKIINYLTQRDRIDQSILVELQETNHAISNMLEFKCKMQTCLSKIKVNREESQKNFCLVVIDHCEFLLEHQSEEFIKEVRNYYKYFVSQKIKVKFVIITSSDLTYYGIEKFYIETKRDKNQQQTYVPKGEELTNSMLLEEDSAFVLECMSFIKYEVSQLSISFLTRLPIISILPFLEDEPKLELSLRSSSRFSGFENHNEKERMDLEWVRNDFIRKCENFVCRLCEAVKNVVIKSIDRSKLMLVLKYMSLMMSVFFLVFNKNEESRYEVERMIHKLINICIDIENTGGIGKRIKKGYKIIEMKLYYIIYLLYDNNNNNSNNNNDEIKIKEIVINHIKNFKISDSNVETANIFEEVMFFKRLINNVLTKVDDRSIKFDSHVKEHIENLINKKIPKVCIDFDEQEEESDDDNVGVEEVLDVCYSKYWSDDSINMTIVSILPLLKYKIIGGNIMNGVELLGMENIIEEYDFMNNTVSIYYVIYKNFKEDYIEMNFEYLKLKLKLNHEQYCCNISRIDVIKKLNLWIQICLDENFISLKNNLLNYKITSFNSFVALVSIPVYKLFRFEKDIVEILHTPSSERLNKSIFPRRDSLTIETLAQYEKDDLPIPVALFVADTKTNNKKENLIILEDYLQKECIREVPIKDLNFFTCDIAIFCGENVLNNIQKEKFEGKVNALIRIDTVNEKMKKEEDNIKKKHHQIVYLMLTKELLISFYKKFCEIMFGKTVFVNRLEQFLKSYIIAKNHAKLSCLIKYGTFYDNKVEDLFENMGEIEILNPKLAQLPPLRLSEKNDHNWGYRQDHESSPLNVRGFTEVFNESLEIGFCDELSILLKKIVIFCSREYRKKEENIIEERYVRECIFISCRKEEEENFIKNLKIKLERMNIVDIKDENSNQIFSNNINSSSLRNLKYEKYPESSQNKVILEIVRQRIQDKDIQELKEQKLNTCKWTNPYIFLFFFNQAICDNEVNSIEVDREANRNSIPILCKMMIENSGNKDKDWENKFFKTMSQRIEHKKGKCNFNKLLKELFYEKN